MFFNGMFFDRNFRNVKKSARNSNAKLTSGSAMRTGYIHSNNV